MAKDKLRKEGEVIHEILLRCQDRLKLLRLLTASHQENIPVLTLPPRDENKGFPFNTENKKTQVRKEMGEEVFPGGRKFK